ncbi:hypothetical protein F5Y12DRAFT_758700 [Xylaria sp. FL1777]|nr:hypothetical protein F5Y12DRAFT_758700 [Xylaria sp. FL1777]
MALRLRELIALIEQIQHGRYDYRSDEPLIKKDLRPYEYRQLLRILQNPKESTLRNCFQTKLRYEYLPSKCLFIIHMITPLHEHVTRRLDTLVINWLDSLETNRKSSKEVVEAARSMVMQGAANVPLSGISNRQPDNSYRHKKCKFPGLVVKVAWGEPLPDLQESAKAFITESRGAVRTVVGINLTEIYEARKKGQSGNAVFFVWKAKFNSSGRYSGIEKGEDRVFQNRAGRTVTSTVLELSFEDFLCKRLANKIGSENPKLKISATQLSKILAGGLEALDSPADEESDREEPAVEERDIEESAIEEDDREESNKEESESGELQDSSPVPESHSKRMIRKFTNSFPRSHRIQGHAAGPGLP